MDQKKRKYEEIIESQGRNADEKRLKRRGDKREERRKGGRERREK